MAIENEAQAVQQDYRAWRDRIVNDIAIDDWATREQAQEAFRRWLACAPSESTPWWPGGWRIRLASGDLLGAGGVHNVGVWRSRADAQRFLMDPFTDPVVAQQDSAWRPIFSDTLSGAAVEWATAIGGLYQVALDDAFWADVDNGRPLTHL